MADKDVSTPMPPPGSAATSATPWGWIAAALAVVIAAALAFVLRRRPGTEEREGVEDVAPPPPAPPVEPRQPRPKSARPGSATPTPPTAPATRPWIEIDLAIDSVRLAVAGLSVAYRIALRNRGDDVARGVIVHALLGHADANQNELLRAFFAGQSGQPVHSAAEIAAGESLVLTGELLLPAQAIEPVELDGRLLVVPLVAFDAQYRWDAGSTPGGGRTGSAFIVGREQTPPSPRLAPFRYDLGLRDHGGAGVGCRRTALSLAS